MLTNKEIRNRYINSFLGESDFTRVRNLIDKMLAEAQAEGYKKGQRDAAKQIFKELEGIKDEYGNSLYGKGMQYAELKKKYKVD